ncbi:T9SS C-terminal target domain-containing protein [Prevotella jejuni]|uniref:T9SS C-terminal target domain-containing protein n=1 Tax=Prevotella jejuni TaxID=1177574 RepID=UPI001BA98033|nr:T9SS C-terminal target domain-containing protein [Prevotella jejuni]QUB80342.1 T9SS C-terminal target domain-containing protein [Prevotella jejuni]
MKLRLLVLIGLLTSLLVSAQAQTSNNDVAFVDAQGKVIPNGTTVVLNAVKDAMFSPGWKEIAGEVYIKNTSDKELKVTLYSRINNIHEGNVTVCALGGCTPVEEGKSTEIGSQPLLAGSEKKSIAIEHTYEHSEKGSITLKITTKESESGQQIEGPSITIKFDTDPTAIAGVASQKGLTYDVFNTQGTLLYKQLTSLAGLPKGLYLVRQQSAKGITTTKKYVIH